MPRVDKANTITVGEFFTPSVRQQKLREMNVPSDSRHIQNTTWKIIRNLSQTAAKVHEQGHLIGDINERNIVPSGLALGLVEPQHGDVSIIDCDSFQIRDVKNRVIYRCKVGRPEYGVALAHTAPELLRQMQSPCTNPSCPNESSKHKIGYPCITRDQAHDKFKHKPG